MWKSKNNFFSKELSKYSLNLPSGHNLKRRDVKYICEKIVEVLK
jgi:dTDP-4-amino-4,6-dideoxygalactose transaminase